MGVTGANPPPSLPRRLAPPPRRPAAAQLAAAEAVLAELVAGPRSEDIAAAAAEAARRKALAEQAVRASGREGAVPAAGAPTLDLLETAAPRARVGVAGGAAADFSVGQSRRLRGADGQIFSATVAAVRPDRAGRGRTVDVLLDLPAGAAGRVRRGDLVRLAVDRRAEAPCVAVPVSALTESRRGLWAAYVAVPLDAPDANEGDAATHAADRREVELLHTDGETAYVRGPLAAGEALVVAGVARLVPGLPVRVAE